MAATTTTVPYDCIYAQFPNGTSWGFVKRGSGDWSWSEMRNIQHTADQPPPAGVLDKMLKPIFVDTVGGEEKSRPVDPKKKVYVTYACFQEIFPDHPDELEPFQLTGAKVSTQYARVAAEQSSSDEEASRWSTFG